MKHTKKLAFLLALATLFTTACTGIVGNTEPDPADTSDITSTVGTDDADGLEIPTDLKTDYPYLTILTGGGIMHGPDEFTDDLDVLNQAMYERRKAVEDRIGVDLKFYDVTPHDQSLNITRQSINSGSDDYQMTFFTAFQQITLVNEGLYLSHSYLPYINIEKPWWNKQYIDSVSLNAEEPTILFGDICHHMISYTTCVFFNINLLDEKLGMAPQDLYDIVYNGEWTIDKMAEIAAQVYEDDGNTINDENDIHGMVYYGGTTMSWLAYSAGLEFIGRDDEGYPTLALNNEKTIELTDKLVNLLKNNEGVYNVNDNHGHMWKFGNGKALFVANRFTVAGWEQFRTMEDDFGILPMPKYDENVDGYHSAVDNNTQWGAVPMTVADPAFVSAAAEALAYETHMRVTPAYYETTLKLKQTRDDSSMAMIDYIMAGRDTDYLYLNPLGGMTNIFAKIYATGNNSFASQYATLEMAALTTLNDLIEAYKETRDY